MTRKMLYDILFQKVKKTLVQETLLEKQVFVSKSSIQNLVKQMGDDSIEKRNLGTF